MNFVGSKDDCTFFVATVISTKELSKVIDSHNHDVMQYDSQALYEELDRIRLEHISGLRSLKCKSFFTNLCKII